MPKKLPIAFSSLTLLGLTSLASPTLAQSITATPDGTGTVIQHNGNTYTITGGTQAGANLFHTFTELGLSPTEIANFLSNPQTQNILGRVTGGNPSIIQGLIQVTGGNSNLLLMNPAGMVFTQGASLNIPGSFTATTADAIGFDNGFFTATGTVDYSNLTSSPNSFVFSGQNGSLVNAANLNVSDGNLALLSSSVINTGTLSAPNGNITLTAVPDSKTVRINQEGMVLGLEIAPPNLESGISATDLPRLLTDPSLKDATGVTVGANGELSLTGSNVSIDATGNVIIAGNVSGNQVHLAAANDVNPVGNPETRIRTHNNQHSAPTVTRFAANSSDPNVHIFLDATIPDYSDLLFGAEAGTTTTVVVPTENGIDKITDTLTTPGLSLVDELHIVSEGNEGNFWLGNAFVSGDNISQYETAMQQWSQGLSVGADILLYACLTAAGSVGEALLNNIASYTGADVAGSTNLTGAGGDWILERSIGSIEADAPFEAGVLSNYNETLALLTVTSIADNTTADGQVTLREAILAANNNANTADVIGMGAFGNDEIRFDPGITQITLTIGQLDIDTAGGGLTIDGDANGAANVIVERSTAAGTPDFRIFNITGDNDVTFDALTIRNGNAAGFGDDGGGIKYEGTGTLTLTNSNVSGNSVTDDGGGIFSNGTVILTNSTVSSNFAASSGGGIRSARILTLTNSTVSGNSAQDNVGGIASYGAVTLTNSTVSGNSAGLLSGGIASHSVVTLTNSTVSSNSAGDDGGGIASYGAVNLTDSTVSGNSARNGGGIWSGGAVTLTDSTVSGNNATGNGGGTSSGITVTLTNSTVSGNSAGVFGGGIYSDSIVSLTDSTVSGNSAARNGGGIYTYNGVVNLTDSTVSGNAAARNGGGIRSSNGGTITNSTITNNTADSDGDGTGDGGGIFRRNGTFTITNSIIAGNFDRSPAGNNVHPDVSGININGDANNLIGDTTGATGTIGTGSDRTFAGAGITDINQVLAPLANNGGSTQTHALVPGSAALDAGNNANAPAGTDQRGATRIFNNTVDIGAVEMQFVLQPTGTPQSTQVSTAFTNPLSVQLADAFANAAIPFAGLQVTFAAPGTGASGSFGNGVTVLTNAQGIAVNPFTANGIAGNYQVTATATGTQLATFDLTNTAQPTSSTPTSTSTTTSAGTTTITTSAGTTVSLTAPPESDTPPDVQDPPQTLASTAPTLACSGAANNSNFAPLNLEIPTIAGLMNAGGGSTSSSLSGLASECGSGLAAAQGNQQLANAYLQSTIAEQIGTEYADLVQVRLVSSAEGITAIIEVQPAPSPAFVTTEDESIFYLYEDGNVRDLDPAAIELYQQQRWPQ